MPTCVYCREEITSKNDNGRAKVFCDEAHEKLWHRANRGASFTTFDGDTPDIVEMRKARMDEYHRRHTLACNGDREACRWMRQVLRLKAIWDARKKREVRL